MNHPKQDFKNKGEQRHYGNQNPEPEKPNWSISVQPEWITTGIDIEAVKFSDNFGRYLADNYLTTSQIRNIFGELKRIQLKGFNEEKTSFLLLLPKVAYASKRNKNEGTRSFKVVFDKIHPLVNSQEAFENMMNLMEAILAYHKTYEKKNS